jgi:hypothetical protein
LNAKGSGGIQGILMTLPDFGVQGGVSFEASPLFSLGPFVGVAMGRISYGSSTNDANERHHLHIRSENRRFHEWLNLGVRGNFTL